MATNAIFPNSNPKVDMCILSHMGTNSLINMSGVNKHAKDILHNDRYFKPFFFRCYPDLEEFKDRLFVILCKWHPGCCWKVACDALAKQTSKVSTSFCSTTIPQIRALLESKIEKQEAKLGIILNAERYRLIEQLKAEKLIKPLRNQLFCNKNRLESLKSPVEELPECKQSVHPVTRQALALRSELCCALWLHKGINDEPLLSECLTEIDNYLAVSGQDFNSKKTRFLIKKKIQSLINASTLRDDNWKRLEKGKNEKGEPIREDYWAEKNFRKFLPELRKIVCESLEHAKIAKDFGLKFVEEGIKYLQDCY